MLASFGHVRDLPTKDGSVRPDDDFAMEYVVEADSKKHLSQIADALKGCEILYLATDPDREGRGHFLARGGGAPRKPQTSEGHRHQGASPLRRSPKKRCCMRLPTRARSIWRWSMHSRPAVRWIISSDFPSHRFYGGSFRGPVQRGGYSRWRSGWSVSGDAEIEKFISQEYWDVTVQVASAKGEKITTKPGQLAG